MLSVGLDVRYVPNADICKSKAPSFGYRLRTLVSGLVSPRLIAQSFAHKFIAITSMSVRLSKRA